MIPDWLIHSLDVSELRRLAEQYAALARVFQSKADDLEFQSAMFARATAAAATRRAKASTWERDRGIVLAYQAGATEAAIAARAGLSERQVRRIARQALNRQPGRLAALGGGANGQGHQEASQQPGTVAPQPVGVEQAKARSR